MIEYSDFLDRDPEIESEDSKLGYDDEDILDVVKRSRYEACSVDVLPDTRFLREYLNSLPFEKSYTNGNTHHTIRQNGLTRIPKHLHIDVLKDKASLGLCISPIIPATGLAGIDDASRMRMFEWANDMRNYHGIDVMTRDDNGIPIGNYYKYIGRFIDPTGNMQPRILDHQTGKVIERDVPYYREIKFNNLAGLPKWDYEKLEPVIEEMFSDIERNPVLVRLANKTMGLPLIMYDPVCEEVTVKKFCGDGFFVSNFGYICNVENYDLIIGRMQSRRYYILL